MNQKEFKADFNFMRNLNLRCNYEDTFGYTLIVYAEDLCLKHPTGFTMFWSPNIEDMIKRLCFPVRRCDEPRRI